MHLLMNAVARPLSLATLLLVSCSSPTPVQPVDAGPSDMGVVDAGAITPMWRSGPDFPTPIAFGSAVILPGPDSSPYLYAVGGVSSGYPIAGPFHAEIWRSQIQGDNSLGPWQAAGHISNGGSDLALAGHGAIRIYMDGTNANGLAIAGGGGPGGTLPLVLAGYVQSVDGSLGGWGAFPPRISMAQGGQVFGSFNSFEAHQLALVGGLQGSTPTDHVIIAQTMAGTMVPTWLDGPHLPAARFGHGTVQSGTVGAQDIYVIGGNGATGPISEVLCTVRDATSMAVTGWATAGFLTQPVVFPQTVLINSHVYVMGGIPGDPVIDDVIARVRMATLTHGATGGTISTFADVPTGALPAGRAGGLVASIGPWVYIVGGLMGSPHTASASVIYARMEQ